MPISKPPVVNDLARKTILLWGPPKIGKSCLASQFPDAVFIATERGLDDLEATRWMANDERYVVNGWEEICLATREVIESGAKTIVLDTADNAYFMCESHICNKYGVDYRTDGTLAYGKGTALINNEFRRYLLKTVSVGVGVILVSHATVEELEDRKMAIPTLPDKIRPMLMGMMDMILYMTVQSIMIAGTPTVQRIIHTKPSPHYIAGDRTGRLPATIVLPDDPTQNYATFITAFNAKTESAA